MSLQLIKQVLANSLEIDGNLIQDSASMDTISEWDSIKHLRVILGLEDAFGISFTELETTEIISLELIKIILSEHGVTFEV